MPGELADSELISEVLKGRKESFAVLVGKYQKAAFKTALVILRHPADAEDAVSEAFMKAYSALPGCRKETNFKSWLLKITHNCCMDILRKRVTGAKYELAESVISAAGGNPLEEILQAEKKQSLWSALAELDPDDRSAVVMKYYHGLSYREIGEQLHWPMGTVASRLARAREKLHRVLRGGDNNGGC